MSEALPRRLAIVVVGLGWLLRGFRLEADPHYYGWWGHIFDEGRWVEHARSVVLFGTMPESLGHNALIAPLFEVATAGVFLAAGVSHLTARLLPLVCGCLLVLGVYLWLRERTTPEATLVGVAMVAFPADLVVLSRLATPEMPAMLGTFLTFVLLAGAARPTRGRLILAGLVCAATVGFKMTSIFSAGIFVLVALALRPPGAPLRERLSDAFWFGLAIAVPAAIVAGTGLILVAGAGMDLGRRLDIFMNFFGLRPTFAIVSLSFFALDAAVIVPSCLALWAAVLARLGARDRDADDLRWLRAASVWAAVYIVVFVFQKYFPGRYRIHVLVPLALVAAHALGRLQRDGLGALGRVLRDAGGLRRLALVGFVVFPASLQLAALATAFVGAVGIDPERLSTRIVATALAWGVAFGLLLRAVDREIVLARLLAFSLVAGLLHFAHWIALPFTAEFFLVAPAELPLRVALLAAAAAAAWWIGARRSAVAASVRAPAIAGVAVYALAWVVHVGPGLFTPTYTARDTSRAVGELLAHEDVIHQHRAEGFFISNELWFTNLLVPEFTGDPPALVVTDLPMGDFHDELVERYEIVHTFELYVPAAHYFSPPDFPGCSGAGQCFGILRRRPGWEQP